MQDILKLAEQNIADANEIIKQSGVIQAWESVGATVNLVGSLRNGMFMKSRDIDMHIYTDNLDIAQSFKAVSLMATNPRIKKVTYTNLLDDTDSCLEWHAFWEDEDKNMWQIDMMHIIKGSTYDGHFEKFADRLKQVATEEQRNTILKLKHETPDGVHFGGIYYYVAVIRDGVSDYEQFLEWLEKNKESDFMNWMP